VGQGYMVTEEAMYVIGYTLHLVKTASFIYLFYFFNRTFI